MALVTANQFQLQPNTAGAISGGLQLGGQIRQFRSDRQQEELSQQVSTLRQQALGGDQNALSQLAGIAPEQAQQVQQFQSGQSKAKALVTDARKKSVFEAALNLSNLPDDDSKLSFLKQREQDLISQGVTTQDTSPLIKLFESGQAEQANLLIEAGVQTGTQLGFIKPSQQAAFQKGEGGLVFNPNTGDFTINPAAKRRFDELAVKANTQGSLDFKDRQSLNKDVTSLLKNTVMINNTAKDLEKLGKLGTGPASIALVFKFMKALDPTSVVREGEFATAENSAGVPESIGNIYNKLVRGERLGDVQIEQFIQTAKDLSDSSVSASKSEVGNMLTTFGDTIPEKFKGNLLGRIPELFNKEGAGKVRNLTALSDDDLLDF